MVICTNCGIISEDCNILRLDKLPNDGRSYTGAFFNFTGLPSTYSTMLAKRRRELTAFASIIRESSEALADQLSFTKDMKIQLKSLIKSALECRRWTGPTGRALSGVCVFLIMTRNNAPVTVKNVTTLMEDDCAEKFTSTYYKLLKALPSTCPVVKKHGCVYELLMTGFQIPENEKKPLFERVKRLIDVIGQLKCLDSILSVNFVIAATFISWKSLDRSRQSMRFSHFCCIHQVDMSKMSTKTIMIRVKEILEYLIACARKIHFLKDVKINIKNILKFFDTILDNESCVVYDLKLDRENEWKLQDLIVEHQNKRFKRGPVSGTTIQEVDEDEEEYISDTEIDSYIRTESEVEIARQLFEANQNESNE